MPRKPNLPIGKRLLDIGITIIYKLLAKVIHQLVPYLSTNQKKNLNTANLLHGTTCGELLFLRLLDVGTKMCFLFVRFVIRLTLLMVFFLLIYNAELDPDSITSSKRIFFSHTHVDIEEVVLSTQQEILLNFGGTGATQIAPNVRTEIMRRRRVVTCGRHRTRINLPDDVSHDPSVMPL